MPTNAAHHFGATAKPAPMVAIDPARLVLDEHHADLGADAGLNGPFVADLLSDVLMHARCGLHLYRSLAGRSNNPILKGHYERFVEKAANQIAITEELVAEVGGDPGYTSPISRVTEKYDLGALEGSFLLAGSVDLMDQEMAMVNAVLLAETVTAANWETVAALAEAVPEGPTRDALDRAVAATGPTPREALDWARETRQRLVLMQARSSAMQRMGLGATALMDKVHSWFGDDAPVPT